jgi:phosphatidylserine decarboxylase
MLVFTIILVLGALAGLFLLNFYRDPERKVPGKENIIVSPCDGRVISIIRTSKPQAGISKGFLGKIRSMTKDVASDCYVVSIFMSPLNVHINRVPISGKVTKVLHQKGNFFKAYDLEKSFTNEKNEVLFEGKIKVKSIQIAGFLARRIFCRVKEGQRAEIGQRYGNIALGSQTTLIMPSSVNLKVKVGDKAKGAETIIAEIKVKK